MDVKREDGFMVKVLENPVQQVNGFPLQFQNLAKFVKGTIHCDPPKALCLRLVSAILHRVLSTVVAPSRLSNSLAKRAI